MASGPSESGAGVGRPRRVHAFEWTALGVAGVFLAVASAAGNPPGASALRQLARVLAGTLPVGLALGLGGHVLGRALLARGPGGYLRAALGRGAPLGRLAGFGRVRGPARGLLRSAQGTEGEPWLGTRAGTRSWGRGSCTS